MIERINDPAAIAVVAWKSANTGGRKSGPPTTAVYAATAVFIFGDDEELMPDWPRQAPQLSILLERENLDDSARYKIKFLVQELARPYLHPGAELLIMEGPKVVANAQVTDVVVE